MCNPYIYVGDYGIICSTHYFADLEMLQISKDLIK